MLFRSTNGLLDLNNFVEGIGSLDMTGGAADSGTSSLVLFGGGVTTHSSGFQAGISGSLNLGGAVRTFDVASGTAAPDLLVSAVISNGGVTQTGGGTLYFSGANTYSGLTTISNGLIEVVNATGLGTTNAGTVLNGGDLYIISVTVVNEGLTNNGSSANLFESSGVCGWSGNITMNAPLDLVVFGTSLDLSGVISGSGSVVKSQSGTLTYSGGSANTYTNTTTVSSGTLQLSKTSVNGTIVGDLTISGGGGGDTVQLMADRKSVV